MELQEKFLKRNKFDWEVKVVLPFTPPTPTYDAEGMSGATATILDYEVKC